MTPSDRIAAGDANPADKGHTAGPWHIRTLENFGFNIVHYVGGDKFNIRRVAKVGDEQDARLIAAAPDLLNDGALAADMLDMMLKCWVESREISDEEGRQATAALMRFNAAIVRARGAQ